MLPMYYYGLLSWQICVRISTVSGLPDVAISGCFSFLNFRCRLLVVDCLCWLLLSFPIASVQF
jgi:hypothetical protein